MEEEVIEVLTEALLVEVHRLYRLHDTLLQLGTVDGTREGTLLVVEFGVRP